MISLASFMIPIDGGAIHSLGFDGMDLKHVLDQLRVCLFSIIAGNAFTLSCSA
jgi:hypothetical protein